MTDSLFNDNNDTPVLDQNKNYLEELVGDGKKFKSVDDLAKGKAESDAYIELLTKRMDELRAAERAAREDAQSRANLADLVDRLSTSQTQNNSTQTQAASHTEQPTFDPTKIEELISSKLQANEAARTERANRESVMGKLRERYGSNYVSALKTQSSELGLDESAVNDMAAKHPALFLRTFGLDRPVQTEPFMSPPQSSRRNDNFAPQGSEKRTWSYYQNLKKTNPNLYNDPKITVQMHKDYELLGAAFEDGDFKAV